jgi:LacI family transcriptional regulator
MGVYQAAQEMGLRIPEDLSVVGFDNIMESKYMGLTTVDQFISEMGFVATQMLIQLINGEPLETQTYKTQTRLVIRSSCQPVKPAGKGRTTAERSKDTKTKSGRR